MIYCFGDKSYPCLVGIGLTGIFLSSISTKNLLIRGMLQRLHLFFKHNQGHHSRFLAGKTTNNSGHIIGITPMLLDRSIPQNPDKTAMLLALPLVAAIKL
jgi:hypothetical protein